MRCGQPSRCCNRLSKNWVGNIAGREYPGGFSRGEFGGFDIAVVIGIDKFREDVGIWFVTDRIEKAVQSNVLGLAGGIILQSNTSQSLFVKQELFGGVWDHEADLRVLLGTL